MASPSTVISLGYGSWGSVNDVITLGYGLAAEQVVVILSSARNNYQTNAAQSHDTNKNRTHQTEQSQENDR